MSKNPPAYPDLGFTPATNYQPAQQNYPQPNYAQQNYPQPNYPQYNQGTVPVATVVINAAPPVSVGPERSHVICPSCRADIMTDVKTEANNRTHFWAIFLFLFFCWPCVCVPYCMDSCKTTIHSCPNCHAYIGKYEP